MYWMKPFHCLLDKRYVYGGDNPEEGYRQHAILNNRISITSEGEDFEIYGKRWTFDLRCLDLNRI